MDNNNPTQVSAIDSSASFYSDNPDSERDVSMVDLQRQDEKPTISCNSVTSQQSLENPTLGNQTKRKSNIILTDDNSTSGNNNSQGDDMAIDDTSDIGQNHGPQPTVNNQPVLIPTVFKWTEGGSKVFVMGTFTGWRKMIALNGPSPKDGSFTVQIALPAGTHRFKFVVDNDVKCSNFIPTATDNSGHFVNYLEVSPSENDLKSDPNSKSKSSLRTLDSKLGLTKDDDDMGDGYSRYYDDQETCPKQAVEYITDIPPIFTDPKVMEEYYLTLDNNQRHGNHSQQWLIPPQLPPHLENVILNSYNSSDKANTSGALSIPNHVVLNHLATTSIKHNTLAVASVVRYKRKYVTQILYAPLQ